MNEYRKALVSQYNMILDDIDRLESRRHFDYDALDGLHRQAHEARIKNLERMKEETYKELTRINKEYPPTGFSFKLFETD